MMRALLSRINASGSTLLQFSGTPARAVTWSIESGTGTVTAFSAVTDATGSAWALYEPVGETTAVVRVTYGA